MAVTQLCVNEKRSLVFSKRVSTNHKHTSIWAGDSATLISSVTKYGPQQQMNTYSFYSQILIAYFRFP